MERRNKKQRKLFNKTALITAIVFSIGTAANASSDNLRDHLFGLNELNSYLPDEVIARCGVGSCGGGPEHSPSARDIEPDDVDEEINGNDPKTLKECKQQCKEDFPGKANKKDRKSCIKECKNNFQ